eukprot:1816133-Prymnesium_polylepis.1
MRCASVSSHYAPPQCVKDRDTLLGTAGRTPNRLPGQLVRPQRRQCTAPEVCSSRLPTATPRCRILLCPGPLAGP